MGVNLLFMDGEDLSLLFSFSLNNISLDPSPMIGST